MALLGSGQAPIGLDIGKSSIVGVQISGRSPNFVLKGFAERALPEGIMFEGEVVDAVALGSELKAFMKDAQLNGKVVNLGVGNQKVIVRQIEVPEMGEEELRGAIEFQAQDYIPIPIEEAVLDFQVVNRYAGDDGVGKQQVLLVAAQKEMVHKFLEAAGKAGVKVAGIDVNAFALIRALASPVAFIDQGGETARTLGVVNISSAVSTLVVAVDGVPKFTRIINFTYDAFTRLLVERQGILPEDALALMERVGLPGPVPPDSATYNPVTIDEVQTSLGSVAEELAEEIRRSLDYYQSQDYAGHADHLYLTGRGALLLNLDSYLSEFLGIRVERGNPLLKLVQNGSGVPDEVLGSLAPRLAIAVGLALDEVE